MISKNTSNISFKNMQYRLQDNGISNCFFMNETINKDLVDVDVYRAIDSYRGDPKKKSAFLSRVHMECQKNIWYYFREVVRIPDEYHLLVKDNAGLAGYPLTDRMCKLIYMYDKGLSPVVFNTNDTKSIEFLTLVCLAIREEFFLTHDIDYKSSIVSFMSHTTEEIIFKQAMQEILWAMNDVIGNIGGLSPIRSSSSPDFKVFNKHHGITPNGRNSYICPYISSENDIKEFLKESKKREYHYCIGRVVGTNIPSCDLYKDYILSDAFSNPNDYTIYQVVIESSRMDLQYKI